MLLIRDGGQMFGGYYIYQIRLWLLYGVGSYLCGCFNAINKQYNVYALYKHSATGATVFCMSILWSRLHNFSLAFSMPTVHDQTLKA